MPWRMIRFLIIITLVIVFVGLNSGNSSDINFWFNGKGSFKNVPIYISLFGAYVAGAISVIPFALNNSILRYKKRKKLFKKKEEKIEKDDKKQKI